MTLTAEKINKLKGALASLAGVAETLFRDPSDYSKPLRLEPHQVRLFNIVQFGYDILRFPAPPRYPDGKVYTPRFNILPWPRQLGKTTSCALAVASLLVSFPPPVHVGMYGPNEESAKRLLERCIAYMKQSPANLMSLVNKRTLGKFWIELLNGNTAAAYNSSEKMIRGPSVDFAFIDEIDQFERPQIVEGAIVNTTRDKIRFGRGRIFALSTPNMENRNSVFRKWLFRAINEMALYCHGCGASFFIDEFVTDEIGRRDFSPFRPVPPIGPCPECGKTAWDYIYKHYQVIPAVPWESPRISREQVMMELEQLGNTDIARQELLGEVIIKGGGIFTEEMLQNCIDPKLANVALPPPRESFGTYRVTGMDVGRLIDNTVYVTVEQDQRTGDSWLLNIEVIKAAGGKVQWEHVIDYTARYMRRFNPDLLVPDTTGVGDPVLEKIARKMRDDPSINTMIFNNKPNRHGFVFDRRSKLDLVSNLELYITTAGIKFPPPTERGIQELFDEIIDFGYEFTQSNNVVYNAMSGHDDRVIALALALWGLKQKRFPRGIRLKCV